MRGDDTSRDLIPVARRLRRDQTQVERLLWGKLRARRLNGWKFRRQAPIGRFVVDFCCADAWLIVELDGSQHGREPGLEADRVRTRELEACGYLVQRFTNGEVIENADGVCETILNLLKGAPAELDQVAPPSPRPSPHRGEGARGQGSCEPGDARGANPLPGGERAG